MSKFPWTPWHKVVTLREDLKTGELALNEFAADLYDVALQTGKRRVYEDPREFFALTFPTLPLRELAKDVIQRLDARNQKAVRQLELTYGGGKTHTLITLFHLVNDPARLPDLASVREFRSHIGIQPPPTRVAILPFDKFDVEKGIEVKDPAGRVRLLRQPWSVIAWQLAGSDGVRILHPDSQDEERRTAPAENWLVRLLEAPQKEGRSTLILIDEVLFFARNAVDADPGWRERLKNFFQALTQAATKVDRSAIVASLLATDPAKGDQVGREITSELYDIFRREREEGVEPVGKNDVAEVLRRRFFTPKSIEDSSRFRVHVIEALKGIADLDDETRKTLKEGEERFGASYPFHPDLTEVLYSKWTQLQGFQRTRGVLRTFAQALRDAEKWDDASPRVGPAVFLGALDGEPVSQAARELTQVATHEDHEGKRQEWTAILGGELDKARRIQSEFGGLRHREIEQAVFATFVHSQPPGQRAQLRELLVLVGATRPDKIELRKALREWFERSWFLDESADAESKADNGVKPPPAVWRLGSRPNLKQMHAEARTRIEDATVEDRLVEEIRKAKNLTATASQAGARVHNLPERPALVDDDGEFRYIVLGPSAASESGKPSPEARRFLDETTGPERPRKERNAIVLAVPSKDGLYAARTAARDYLAWLSVSDALRKEGHELDFVRQQNLDTYTGTARKRIADTIQQAYCIVVTVGENNDGQAFKLQTPEGPLFSAIKSDPRARIEETAISPDALLPGGPYQLWRENEDTRPVRDLVGAFARFARLPKMLNRQAIYDTVVRGCVDGYFVSRLTRPDKSVRTWWRQPIEREVLEDPMLELVLPEKAELSSVLAALVAPGAIDALWRTTPIPVTEARGFFDGEHVMQVPRGGFEEPVPVPKAAPAVVDEAIRAAVREGRIWLTHGPASILGEDVPPTLLAPEALLQGPPAPVSPLDLLPGVLPSAWRDGQSDVMSLAVALSARAGKTLPWATVREALEAAFRMRLIERAPDSGPWPCEYAAAAGVRVRVPSEAPPPPPPKDGRRTTAEVLLRPNQLQDLVDVLPELIRATAGHELAFALQVQLAGGAEPSEATLKRINELLKSVDEGMKLT